MIQEVNLENLDILEASILTKEEVLREFDYNPFAKYLVYIEKSKVIGYLYYSDIYERMEINQIEVDLIHRNCGIGTKLLKKLTETVEKEISLEVKVDNIPALSLYRKFGFIKESIRKGYYNGKDGILMIRKI